MNEDNAEQLLFTDKVGDRTSVQALIDDGLDGEYGDRVPGLIKLLQADNPYHALLAAMMLVAWGVPDGFDALVKWASAPDRTPWADTAVTHDRLSGADNAFEMLADALQISFWNDPSPALTKNQAIAVRVLLRLYSRFHFGRALALAIARDRMLTAMMRNEMVTALEQASEALRDRELDFDLPFQFAALLIPLARIDDAAAAKFADQLINVCPECHRALRECASSLAEGIGPDTLTVLERLTRLPAVAGEANDALARRHRPAGSESTRGRGLL